MTRYYLSTPETKVTVTVDEQNIVRDVTNHVRVPTMTWLFIGDDLNFLLEALKPEGQVEMIEI